MGYTLAFDSGAGATVGRVGGKCAGLLAMTGAGAPVPPGFAVTTGAFEAMLDRGGIRPAIDAALDGLDVADADGTEARGAEVRRLVAGQPVPPDVAEQVTAAYRALGDGPVAVRSSAVTEDLPTASFAGQHDTYLWIQGADALLDAVRRCWASLWTARAMVYRAANAVPERGLRMAVEVQRMVDARSAGVAMTVNPADGDRSKIVIDAGWGLGELVVSGEVTPDNHVVDKVLLIPVRTTVSHKRQELVVAPDRRGLVRRPVEEARREAPCLTPGEVTEIARLAKAVERYYGVPQDIEWAVDRGPPAAAGTGRVLLLQSRPETAWSRRPRQPATRIPEGAGVASIADAMLGLGDLPT